MKIVFLGVLAFLILCVPTFADSQPPVLQSVSISPTSVDVSNGEKTVTVTVRVTDSPAGLDWGSVAFRSPSGQQTAYGDLDGKEQVRVSGNDNDGTYGIRMRIPQFAEAGLWNIDHIQFSDKAGNRWSLSGEEVIAHFSANNWRTSFEVVDTNPDMEPPVLQSVSISPTSVDVSNGEKTVTVTVRVTDSPAGLDWGSVAFRSPSGQQTAYGDLDDKEQVRVSGNDNDGTYGIRMRIPQFAEAGLWNIDHIQFSDKAGNRWLLSGEEVIAYFSINGWQKSFIVSDGSLSERELGRLDVQLNPAEYGLIRVTDIHSAAGNREALTRLIGTLSKLGLFTEHDILDLNVQNLMIKKNGDLATIWLRLQTSTDLGEWENADTLEYSLPVPQGKWFIRARALGAQ